MARRIRSIKPEILDDEVVAALPHLAWRLFISLITMADDHGNLHGAPGKIRGAALWATDASDGDTRESLARLSRDSLIRVYTVRGQSYVSIRGWKRHQRVDKPGKPIVPGPELADSSTCDDSRESRETPANHRETLATDLDLDQDQDHDLDQDRIAASPRPAEQPASVAEQPSLVPGTKPRVQRKRPACTMPDGFAPDLAHREFAAANAIDLATEFESFRLHHEARGSMFASWSAALSTWLRNAVKFRRPGPQGGGRRDGYRGQAPTAGGEVDDLLRDIPADEFNHSTTRRS